MTKIQIFHQKYLAVRCSKALGKYYSRCCNLRTRWFSIGRGTLATGTRMSEETEQGLVSIAKWSVTGSLSEGFGI
jgi:hypothetical protein